MAADNHDPKMGPFIIEEWIDGVPFSTFIEEHPRPLYRPVLCKDISDETLKDLPPNSQNPARTVNTRLR